LGKVINHLYDIYIDKHLYDCIVPKLYQIYLDEAVLNRYKVFMDTLIELKQQLVCVQFKGRNKTYYVYMFARGDMGYNKNTIFYLKSWIQKKVGVAKPAQIIRGWG